MSRGFLMFAHNNEQVDYGVIALCNALMIKDNCTINDVALITDGGTYDWLVQSHGEELVNRAFDHVLIHAPPPGDTQKKRYRDTQYTGYDLPWHNATRTKVYDHTPFDETVLIDSDYLIMDNALDSVWGSTSDIRINRHAATLNHEPVGVGDSMLEPFSVPMYWATCVYFRKGQTAQTLFDMVDFIRENYELYQALYRFPGRLYRNDYAFSIAAHIMGGWVEGSFEPLPTPTLLTSFDCDELIEVPAKNELLFLVEDPVEPWRYRANALRGMSVHVMNKFSIVRMADRLIGLYGGNSESTD